MGFIIHPLLVHDRDTGIPRGVANIELLDRPILGNKRSKEWNRKSCLIEEKESYKWIRSCEKIMDTVLFKPEHKLFIMDREADIIENYDRLKTDSTDVLIRSSYDRRVKDVDGNDCKMGALLSNQPILGTIEIKVKGKKRKAKLDVKIAQVELQWPQGRKVGYKKIRKELK